MSANLGQLFAYSDIRGEAGPSRKPDALDRRCVDGSGNGRVPLDQRYVDGEFSVLRDEFTCSVERIDEKKAIAYLDLIPRGHGLFSDDRNARRQGEQSLGNDRLGSFVSRRDRAAIPLRAKIAVAPIFLDHRRAGQQGDFRKRQRYRVSVVAMKIDHSLALPHPVCARIGDATLQIRYDRIVNADSPDA
jgi:hypothetical protein